MVRAVQVSNPKRKVRSFCWRCVNTPQLLRASWSPEHSQREGTGKLDAARSNTFKPTRGQHLLLCSSTPDSPEQPSMLRDATDQASKSGAIDETQPHSDGSTVDESQGVKAVLSVIRFYKQQISPMLPPGCRFLPTCSEYGMNAYTRYGMGKGTILTAWRILRCNPLGPSGYDPVQWPPPGLSWIFKS